MKIAIAALSIAASLTPTIAWVQWGNRYWTTNPPIHTNTSTPEAFRPFVPNTLAAWLWSGSYYYPAHAGTTGRDCADGDSWGSDDDDGYNVVDYATTCHDKSNDCTGALAWTHVIDVYNWNTSVLAEVDIVMCSNQPWTTSWNQLPYPNDYLRSYPATLTHEVGHLMSLDHTNAPVALQATMHTFAQLGNAGSFNRTSLSNDDVLGVRWIYGTCSNSEWVIEATAGHAVSKTDNYICGANMLLYPRGTGAVWTDPVVFRQNRLGGWVRGNTYVEWEEYDRDHSMVITLDVQGVDGVTRQLNYARNASNWWPNAGWLGPQNVNNVPNFNNAYNVWVECRGNITSNYLAEYGVNALAVTGFRMRHFAYTGWTQNQDHGGGIRDVVIHRW